MPILRHKLVKYTIQGPTRWKWQRIPGHELWSHPALLYSPSAPSGHLLNACTEAKSDSFPKSWNTQIRWWPLQISSPWMAFPFPQAELQGLPGPVATQIHFSLPSTFHSWHMGGPWWDALLSCQSGAGLVHLGGLGLVHACSRKPSWIPGWVLGFLWTPTGLVMESPGFLLHSPHTKEVSSVRSSWAIGWSPTVHTGPSTREMPTRAEWLKSRPWVYHHLLGLLPKATYSLVLCTFQKSLRAFT